MLTFANVYSKSEQIMINIQRVSKSFQKILNSRFLLMFMISVFCLLFMHWQLALTIEYEYPF